MQTWLANQFQFLIFAAACALAIGAQLWWLRKVRGARLPWLVWALAAVLVCLSWRLAEQAEARERTHVVSVTLGFARLYADEMEKRGHAKLADDVAADDPLYLSLIATEKSWLALNPTVNDIYTVRKRPDGRNTFIVDSETDYNRNGQYDGEREQRTAVGEIYDVSDPGMERAFRGEPNFYFEPVTDRWGTWVSAYVPLRDSSGRVEGVLGVDFDAHEFAAAIAQAKFGVIVLMALVQAAILGFSTLISVLRARIAERRQAQQALAEMNVQIGIVSRKAGMAEVANSVLHNVGNVLNSVNVSVSLVGERLRHSPIADLPNVVGLLRAHETDLAAYLTGDPTGRQVPGFLGLLAQHWSTEHGALTGEVARLQGSIQHIMEIVSRQQSLSGVSGVLEEAHLPALIEDALAIHADALGKSQVAVRREFETLPRITCDRVKLTQILVNLIANAEESLAGTAGAERQLTVRTQPKAGGGVEIHVIDNGHGIAPEMHERLFTYGFTTKQDGHGFGLHASALAAQDMGGTLRAMRDGTERGATFIVELPSAHAAALSFAA